MNEKPNYEYILACMINPESFAFYDTDYLISLNFFAERYKGELWAIDNGNYVLTIYHDQQIDYGELGDFEDIATFSTGLPATTNSIDLMNYLDKAMLLFLCGTGISDPASIDYINRD